MNPIEQEVRKWLENVVIGLNLCPFASRPYRQSTVHFAISTAANDQDLLADLQLQMDSLVQMPSTELETTILIITNYLQEFADYNDFLDSADWLIQKNHWSRVFQIASFHPQYYFANTSPEDQENLTNRSPYPILHILREASLNRAIDSYPNVDEIPINNIKKMENLSSQDIVRLFPYLGLSR